MMKMRKKKIQKLFRKGLIKSMTESFAGGPVSLLPASVLEDQVQGWISSGCSTVKPQMVEIILNHLSLSCAPLVPGSGAPEAPSRETRA